MAKYNTVTGEGATGWLSTVLWLERGLWRGYVQYCGLERGLWGC